MVHARTAMTLEGVPSLKVTVNPSVESVIPPKVTSDQSWQPSVAYGSEKREESRVRRCADVRAPSVWHRDEQMADCSLVAAAGRRRRYLPSLKQRFHRPSLFSATGAAWSVLFQ